MKFIPHYRKAFTKARNKKSRSRVSGFHLSMRTGKIVYYTTNDGNKHKPNCSDRYRFIMEA